MIKYINLIDQWKEDKNKLLPIIDKVLSKGTWVGGENVLKFEKNISKLCGTKYAVALNSGTDALTLGLYLLGVKRNTEVITPPNSFIASTSVIVHLGAKPVFVDVKDDQNIDPSLVEKAITSKTKAIMPVHLTGRIADMDPLIKISKKYNIPIIEDAAQSIGSKYKNKQSGSFGLIGCFSAHPLKNLNAMGDSGFLTTNDKNIYLKVKDLSNHGMTNRDQINNFGFVSRMDDLQAAILNYRIGKLKKIISCRRKNANLYRKNLKNNKYVYIPNEKEYEFNTYHTFVVQVAKRDNLKKYLTKKKIMTSVHYPIPIHLQPASRYLGYKLGDFQITEMQSNKILSLPINQYLKEKDIKKICRSINKFYEL
tara:strand:- start:1988 stop:3088 length:1101 start_codon:yes stop_codon:yes gene_type:complete